MRAGRQERSVRSTLRALYHYLGHVLTVPLGIIINGPHHKCLPPRKHWQMFSMAQWSVMFSAGDALFLAIPTAFLIGCESIRAMRGVTHLLPVGCIRKRDDLN